jgi:hypothetical protein
MIGAASCWQHLAFIARLGCCVVASSHPFLLATCRSVSMAGTIDKRCIASLALRGVFGLLLCSPISVSADDRISIVRGDCDAGVHLVARGVPMDHLLSRLSEALSFQLRFIGSSDFIVDIDVVRQAPELLVKLSPIDDIIVAQGPDPRCPGRDRVTKVWVLSSGTKNPASGRSPSPTTRPAAATSLLPQMSEAEKQQARENEAALRKARLEDMEH